MGVHVSGNLKTEVPGNRRHGRPRPHQIPVGLCGTAHKVVTWSGRAATRRSSGRSLPGTSRWREVST
eukprot:8421028-Pyramimonas_sp.AAC.1